MYEVQRQSRLMTCIDDLVSHCLCSSECDGNGILMVHVVLVVAAGTLITRMQTSHISATEREASTASYKYWVGVARDLRLRDADAAALRLTNPSHTHELVTRSLCYDHRCFRIPAPNTPDLILLYCYVMFAHNNNNGVAVRWAMTTRECQAFA